MRRSREEEGYTRREKDRAHGVKERGQKECECVRRGRTTKEDKRERERERE